MRGYTRSFAGGEVTPEFWARVDDVKFQTGLATCRNFEVLPHGPVRNRAGFAFVRAAKITNRQARLIPFTFSTTQTMVLEFGHLYVRFHTMGATLESSPGVPYEVATPYAEHQLFSLKFVQSADVLTIVHPDHAPAELRRLGALSWAFTTIAFTSPLAAPTGLNAVATPAVTSPGDPSTQSYVVTSVGADGRDQSPPSAADTCSNNLFDDGAFNSLSWSPVAGATRYNVFRLSGGLYGYIGQTAGTTFVDQGGGDVVTPDISRTPPIYDTVFGSAGNYPGSVSYYEQRRIFAGTTNEPQTLWGTRSATESTMTYSLPIQDDDRIKLRVQAREANTIRHIVPLGNLVLLTSAAEWVMTSINTDAITPTSVSVKPQSYVGANNAQPVLAGLTAIYCAARGGHMVELGYSDAVKGLQPNDLSLRAPHLFDGLDITDLAYSKAPVPTVWCVSTSGKLLGLTYVPLQAVWAWHQHDTDGFFESVCVVAEGDEDVLYAVVRRRIGGQTRRYVERKSSRRFATLADSFFVDSGLSYEGNPVRTFSGLDHLEGKTVSILADGAVMAQTVVTGGSVTIAEPASKVHIGLPITADLVTLPLYFDAQAYGQGRPKNINEVFMRVVGSSGVFAGPSFDKLTPWKQRTVEPYGAPPERRTVEVAIKIAPSWGDGGQVCVRQAEPLPLTLLNMTLDFASGG